MSLKTITYIEVNITSLIIEASTPENEYNTMMCVFGSHFRETQKGK